MHVHACTRLWVSEWSQLHWLRINSAENTLPLIHIVHLQTSEMGEQNSEAFSVLLQSWTHLSHVPKLLTKLETERWRTDGSAAPLKVPFNYFLFCSRTFEGALEQLLLTFQIKKMTCAHHKIHGLNVHSEQRCTSEGVFLEYSQTWNLCMGAEIMN